MQTHNTFESWLGELFDQPEFEVRRLLEDKRALHFLIAWSLFESKCFNGFVKVDRIHQFSEEVAADEKFNKDKLVTVSIHFHNRYQDSKRLRNLLHGQRSVELTNTLAKPNSTLTNIEMVFLAVFVIYRFRNNMFHGNKGVDSWLNYGEQIALCTEVLQNLVSRSEAMETTMKTAEAA